MPRALIVGFLLMFTASYIDNLRGPILPVLSDLLQLNQKQVSYFLLAGHAAATVATYLLLRLFRKYRETTLLKSLLILSIATIAMIYLPPSHLWFYGAGIAFGFINTSLGTFSNIWILRSAKKNNEARTMCGLHLLYGLGSLVATALVGTTLKLDLDWRIAVVSVLVPILFLLYWVSLEKRSELIKPIIIEQGGFGALHVLLFALFACYVASEVTTSMWMSQYVYHVGKQSLSTASFAATGFFVFMTLSRTAGIFLATPRMQIPLLWFGILTPAIFHLIGLSGHWWAFCLTGLYGPFFPILMARIKQAFPMQWRSVTTWVVIAVQAALACTHVCVGILADRFGIAMAYHVPLYTCLALIPLLVLYLIQERAVLASILPEKSI